MKGFPIAAVRSRSDAGDIFNQEDRRSKLASSVSSEDKQFVARVIVISFSGQGKSLTGRTG
jgi:hypothetical protein